MKKNPPLFGFFLENHCDNCDFYAKKNNNLTCFNRHMERLKNIKCSLP